MKRLWLIGFAVMLVVSCGNRIGEGQYLFRVCSFVDSALEEAVAEAVGEMDVPDSVLLIIDWNYRTVDDTSSYTLSVSDTSVLGISTFHPEYHTGVDIRFLLSHRVEGVIDIAGHRCLLYDTYPLFNEGIKFIPIEINDSLQTDGHSPGTEEEMYLYLDRTNQIVGSRTRSNSSTAIYGDVVFSVVENEPEFPGGLDSLHAFVERNLSNPRQVEGKVLMQFVVERDGRVTELKVRRGIDEESDEEALRVMRMMPRWESGGRQRNTLVRVQQYYAVQFRPKEV